MNDRPAAELIVRRIGQAYTALPSTESGHDDPGLDKSTFVPRLERDVAVACGGGTILYLGPEEGLETVVDPSGARVVEADGALVTPGLVDAHTHLVFDGWRYDEYALRSVGTSYEAIAAAGGGIRSSVRRFRQATADTLETNSSRHLEAMLASGTTTVEIKSGYGLEEEAELRALEVIGRLAARGPQRVVATFMGAHEVPDEWRHDPDGYLEAVVEQMLPAVAAQGIARFCDVFCERDVFTAAQSERILRAGQRLGLGAKIHSDEFASIGGTEMAARIGAVSAEHLVAITPEGIRALAHSATVPVLLPGTTLFLGKSSYAPARRLLEEGAPVALATDFNPGSSTFLSLPLITTIACSAMGLHPAEAWQGITANGAAALGLQERIGTLAPGMAADLVIWDADDYRMIPYAAGHPLVGRVIRGGREVYTAA